MTPDILRESEPTYMNDQTPAQEPSYANTNIQKERTEDQSKGRLEEKKRWEEEMFHNRRPLRAQSVQPLGQQENLTGKANFQAKRFNTSYKSPRSER